MELRSNNEQKIRIVIALTDKDGSYTKHAGILLMSVYACTKSKIIVYVLHDETLTDENQGVLTKITENYGQEIEFVNVNAFLQKDVSVEDLIRIGGNFSRGALYRLYATEIFKEKQWEDGRKLLYLDIDILCSLDIKELWEIDLEGLPIAARLEIKAKGFEKSRRAMLGIDDESCFNSGVLLMDLDSLNRVGYSPEKIFEITESTAHQILPTLGDQDAMCAFFKGLVKPLSDKFNYIMVYGSEENPYDGKVLRHFATNKAWAFPLYAQIEEHLFETAGNLGGMVDSSFFSSFGMAVGREYADYAKMDSMSRAASLIFKSISAKFHRLFVRLPKTMLKYLVAKIKK
jgi:lipopolysaccharide biosynthesis glycosyltransferase